MQAKHIFTLISVLGLLGCAHMHHVQVGQVDNRSSSVAIPFEIKVSETGISVEEAGKIAKAVEGSRGSGDGSKIAEFISLFQMGPRTGNPVYDSHYADKLVYQIYEKCPSGRVTGLMSIRETRKYPVISGEIVKITGLCLKTREPASAGEIEDPLEGEVL